MGIIHDTHRCMNNYFIHGPTRNSEYNLGYVMDTKTHIACEHSSAGARSFILSHHKHTRARAHSFGAIHSKCVHANEQ